MGTATVSIKKRTGITPTGQAVVADVTLSSSYATGGDTVPIASFGLKTLSALMLSGNAGGYVCEAVHGATEIVDPKIKLYDDDATAADDPFTEEANATNVSTVVIRVIAYGDLPNV